MEKALLWFWEVYFIRSKFQSKQSGWCLAFFTYPLTIISGSKCFFCSFFTSPKHLTFISSCWKKYICIRTDFIWRFATSDKATMRTTFTTWLLWLWLQKEGENKSAKKVVVLKWLTLNQPNYFFYWKKRCIPCFGRLIPRRCFAFIIYLAFCASFGEGV